MPTLETLTESDVCNALKDKKTSKALAYVSHVSAPRRSGQALSAQVQGTWLYEVEINVEPSGIRSHCTCSWSEGCKHIGAVLLKWLHAPHEFDAKEMPLVLDTHALEVMPVEPLPAHTPQQLPAWMRISLVQRQEADLQQLIKALEAVKLQDLRKLAKSRGWSVKGAQKSSLMQQIAIRMGDPGEVLKAVLGLDAEHQQALRALVLLDSQQNARSQRGEQLAQVWGEMKGYKQFSTYTHHLCELGLAVSGDVPGRYGDPHDFVPPAIARHLPPMLKNALAGSEALQPEDEPAQLRLADPHPFIRAVNQLILLLEKLPVSLRPPMPRPQLEKFLPVLQGWDYDPVEVLQLKHMRNPELHRVPFTVPAPQPALPDEAVQRLSPVVGGEALLDFVYALLLDVGVFKPGSPVSIWPEVKTNFMCQDELTQRALLARAYFQTINWSEVWPALQAGGLQLKRSAGDLHYKPDRLQADLVRFRRLTLRFLASLPERQWVNLEDVLSLMRVVWPYFDASAWQVYWYGYGRPDWFLARPGSASPVSSIGDARPYLPENKPNPIPVEEWDLAQGNFVRQLIVGPLYWLGLADVYSNQGEVKAVRLHGLADLFWDRLEVAPAPPHAVLSSDQIDLSTVVETQGFDICVSPARLPAPAHILLDKIARLNVARPDRFVYKLDAQAVYQSFEIGVSLSQILDDWKQLLLISMPQPIEAQLAHWWQAYGQVRIYENLTVMEFDDDYVLAEVKAVSSLSQHMIAEISPRLVIIEPAAVATLTAELEKAGYTPKRTDGV